MYLLDTNIISELRKESTKKANPNVINWARSVATSELFISSITILELETGILRIERKDSIQGAMLRTWLNNHVLRAFNQKIIPVDTQVALQYAKLHIPDQKPDRDALIGATAVAHKLTLVTRNIKDFTGINVELINPFNPI